jgi:hypothetical protein
VIEIGRRLILLEPPRAGQAGRLTRITPGDLELEVRIFLAALAAGKSVRDGAKLVGLSERRVTRWVGFNGFGPAIFGARRKGRIAEANPFSGKAVDAMVELTIALQDRTSQRAADRYAGGDRERLHEMWVSGELMAIYDREAIADLRRHGKHDHADRYERALVNAPPFKPIDYVGEELRRVGFKW